MFSISVKDRFNWDVVGADGAPALALLGDPDGRPALVLSVA
jgi:hypothetical protein